MIIKFKKNIDSISDLLNNVNIFQLSAQTFAGFTKLFQIKHRLIYIVYFTFIWLFTA